MDFLKYVKCPWKIALVLNSHGLGRIIPDFIFLKAAFRERMGYRLDLKNPRTFNEKLQWLKLHNRKPIYTIMVDKHDVKKYVASIIGDKYIIPTLGVWDKFEDIDFTKLPDKFVLKCTHDSGGVIIVQNKENFDKVAASKKLNGCLKNNYYLLGREWPYKNVKPRIIAEKYLSNEVMCNEKSCPEIEFDKNIQVIQLDYKTFANKAEVQANHFQYELDNIYQCSIVSSKKVDMQEILRKISGLVKQLSENINIQKIELYDIEGKFFLGYLTVGVEIENLHLQAMEKEKEFEYRIRILNQGGWLIQSDEFAILVRKNFRDQIEDYKFFCFNGKVKCFKVDFERATNHGANYYDVDYGILPFGEKVCPPDFKRNIELPGNIDEMIVLAEKLSMGHPFLRVDMYNVNGDIYFGELTLFPAAGMGIFVPEEWDYILGDEIDLAK